MLRVDNVSVVTTGKQPACLLNSISATLQPGELTMILGANGAGKSTLLSAMSGGLSLQKELTQKGRVYFNDQDIHNYPVKALARRRAVMPQQVRLDFPFKVREVVIMGRSPHGINSMATLIAEQAMALLEVEHLQNRYYPSLSGGEQQRVQLARVLAQLWPDTWPHRGPDIMPGQQEPQPRLLLLDECTSALDPAHQHLVLDIIRRFTTPSVICCAVIHDLSLAAQYADRILLMKQGNIIADGPPATVLNEASLADTYELRTRILHHPQLHHPVIVGLGRQHNTQE